MSIDKFEELRIKRRSFGGGTHITNCVAHANLRFDERPQTCVLCHTDLKNFIRRALGANHFINDLLDEYERLTQAPIPVEIPNRDGDPDAVPA